MQIIILVQTFIFLISNTKKKSLYAILLYFITLSTLKASETHSKTNHLLQSNFQNNTMLLVYAIIILLIATSILIIKNKRIKNSLLAERSILAKKKLLFETIVGYSQVCFWEWDIENSKYYFSPGCYSIIGFKPNEFDYSISTWEKLIHQNDIDKVQTRLNEFNTSTNFKNIAPIEFKILTKENNYISILMSFKIIKSSQEGKIQQILIFQKEIFSNDTLKTSLHDELYKLSKYPIDKDKAELTDFFDIDLLQNLQNSFADTINVASYIISDKGTIITKSSNFPSFCTLIRTTQKGREKCCYSNSKFKPTRGSYQITKCSSGGLVNSSTPIWAGNKIIAYWLIGQIRYSDENSFNDLTEEQIKFAKELDLNLEEFTKAFHKVPVVNSKKFKQMCKTLTIIAEQVSMIISQNIVITKIQNEKEKLENKLALSEDRFIETEKLLLIGSWQLNTENNMLTASKKFWEILHLSQPDNEHVSITESFKSFLPNDSAIIQSNIFQFINQIIDEHTLSKDIEYRLKDTPNTQRYINIKARTISKTTNGFNVIKGTIQDITERTINEIALKKSQEQLQVIFESITNGLIVTDANGIIINANPIALEILNKTENILINNHINDSLQFFESESMLMIENPIIKALYTNSHIILPDEYIFTTDEGLIKHLTLSASPTRDHNGNLSGAILILYDISERYELKQNLRQYQKFETIGKHTGDIVHDFNNLLGGIMGFADLICMNTKDENINNYAKNIVNTTEKAAELTAKLLSFTRQPPLLFTVIDIHECINKAISILKHSIGTNITINSELTAKNHITFGDMTRLQNSLINLGINARDTISEYGEFTIKTADTFLSHEYCQHSTFNIKPGNYISIAASNTGSGISSEILNKVCDPFFTTKDTSKEIGLELSTIFNTIVTHNGAIEIKDSENKGTTFTIYLPIKSEKSYLKTLNNTPENDTKDKTILLVDDQQIAQLLERSILEECGYNILLAENGEQALKMYLERSHIIDLVIMDLVMPIMGGEEATEHLLEMNPEVKIILSSGMDKSSKVEKLITEGKIKAFISKPFTSTKFLETIKEVL